MTHFNENAIKKGHKRMIKLQELLQDQEIVATYHITTDGWCSRNAIINKNSTDIAGALEGTLHRLLEVGGNEKDVKRIMGAEILPENEKRELEEFGEYTYIDLGYVLPGLIDAWSNA